MGTRNLTCVFVDGEYKVAQYGQWDGYPEGQGQTVLDFARDDMREAKFRKRLKQCEWVSDATLQSAGDSWLSKYPYVTRDHGAEILGLIQNRKDKPLLRNALSFAADSLMCEWAYVIDLDKRTLEVYKGFNTEGVRKGERFADLPLQAYSGLSSTYYPVTHVVSFKLGRLPQLKQFVKRIKDALPKDDEEEAA